MSSEKHFDSGPSKSPQPTTAASTSDSSTFQTVFNRRSSHASLEPSAKASQTVLTYKSPINLADDELNIPLQHYETSDVLPQQPEFSGCSTNILFDQDYRASSDSVEEANHSREINAQIIWASDRYSRVDSRSGKARLFIPPPDKAFPDSDSDSSTCVNEFLKPVASAKGRRKNIRISKSVQNVENPPPDHDITKSRTDADTDSTTNSIDSDGSISGEDESSSSTASRSSTGFSLHSPMNISRYRRNSTLLVQPAGLSQEVDVGGVSQDQVLITDALGQREVFWPLMTPSERRMVGAVSELALADDLVASSDIYTGTIIHPSAESSMFLRDYEVGDIVYLQGNETPHLVVQQSADNGNHSLAVGREVHARPYGPDDSLMTPAHAQEMSTSTTELEELTRDEFPENIRNCSVM